MGRKSPTVAARRIQLRIYDPRNVRQNDALRIIMIYGTIDSFNNNSAATILTSSALAIITRRSMMADRLSINSSRHCGIAMQFCVRDHRATHGRPSVTTSASCGRCDEGTRRRSRKQELWRHIGFLPRRFLLRVCNVRLLSLLDWWLPFRGWI